MLLQSKSELTGVDNFELEQEESALTEEVLVLAVTPPEERSREAMDDLLNSPLFLASLEQWHGSAVDPEDEASLAHYMLNDIRDEFIKVPIQNATEDRSGVTRKDAGDILRIVEAYRLSNPATIQAAVEQETGFGKSVFAHALGWLLYVHREGKPNLPTDVDIIQIIEQYFKECDNFRLYPTKVQDYFERQIEKSFNVHDIHLQSVTGSPKDADVIVMVDAALALLAQREGYTNGETPIVGDSLIDEYFEILERRL